MLERIATPDLPPRDILLDCRLVVRDSCGAPGSSNAGRSRTGNGDAQEP
jgi:hypothetical protein